ncbi:cysteine peptidase family C39 domain-containing protein [Vasconcelosia minhoensis]|nr:cysteine peptidase family C39 domain-containing protein [Romeria gracilis]
MVLAEAGTVISESELRRLCDCTIFGTEALQAVEAARQVGFVKARKANLTMVQLDDLVAQGLYPIVYVGLMPIDRVRGIHSLVVGETDENDVTVLDPLVGKRQVNRSHFEAAFRLTNGLTIMIAE